MDFFRAKYKWKFFKYPSVQMSVHSTLSTSDHHRRRNKIPRNTARYFLVIRLRGSLRGTWTVRSPGGPSLQLGNRRVSVPLSHVSREVCWCELTASSSHTHTHTCPRTSPQHHHMTSPQRPRMKQHPTLATVLLTQKLKNLLLGDNKFDLFLPSSRLNHSIFSRFWKNHRQATLIFSFAD